MGYYQTSSHQISPDQAQYGFPQQHLQPLHYPQMPAFQRGPESFPSQAQVARQQKELLRTIRHDLKKKEKKKKSKANKSDTSSSSSSDESSSSTSEGSDSSSSDHQRKRSRSPKRKGGKKSSSKKIARQARDLLASYLPSIPLPSRYSDHQRPRRDSQHVAPTYFQGPPQYATSVPPHQYFTPLPHPSHPHQVVAPPPQPHVQRPHRFPQRPPQYTQLTQVPPSNHPQAAPQQTRPSDPRGGSNRKQLAMIIGNMVKKDKWLENDTRDPNSFLEDFENAMHGKKAKEKILNFPPLVRDPVRRSYISRYQSSSAYKNSESSKGRWEGMKNVFLLGNGVIDTVVSKQLATFNTLKQTEQENPLEFLTRILTLRRQIKAVKGLKKQGEKKMKHALESNSVINVFFQGLRKNEERLSSLLAEILLNQGTSKRPKNETQLAFLYRRIEEIMAKDMLIHNRFSGEKKSEQPVSFYAYSGLSTSGQVPDSEVVESSKEVMSGRRTTSTYHKNTDLTPAKDKKRKKSVQFEESDGESSDSDTEDSVPISELKKKTKKAKLHKLDNNNQLVEAALRILLKSTSDAAATTPTPSIQYAQVQTIDKPTSNQNGRPRQINCHYCLALFPSYDECKAHICPNKTAKRFMCYYCKTTPAGVKMFSDLMIHYHECPQRACTICNTSQDHAREGCPKIKCRKCSKMGHYESLHRYADNAKVKKILG